MLTIDLCKLTLAFSSQQFQPQQRHYEHQREFSSAVLLMDPLNRLSLQSYPMPCHTLSQHGFVPFQEHQIQPIIKLLTYLKISKLFLNSPCTHHLRDGIGKNLIKKSSDMNIFTDGLDFIDIVSLC